MVSQVYSMSLKNGVKVFGNSAVLPDADAVQFTRGYADFPQEREDHSLAQLDYLRGRTSDDEDLATVAAVPVVSEDRLARVDAVRGFSEAAFGETSAIRCDEKCGGDAYAVMRLTPCARKLGFENGIALCDGRHAAKSVAAKASEATDDETKMTTTKLSSDGPVNAPRSALSLVL